MTPWLKLKTLLLADSSRSALYASWAALAMLFVMYSAFAWFNASKTLYQQLDAMNQLISQSTQQHFSDFSLQLNMLSQRFDRAERNKTPIEELFVHRVEDSYDHSMLIDENGKIVFSSFDFFYNNREQATQVIIKPQLLENLQAGDKPSLLNTFSLTAASGSHYLPICIRKERLGGHALCVAVSSENEKLNWNTINRINDTAIRIINKDHYLVFADPLPLHKRSILGTIPKQIDSHPKLDALIANQASYMTFSGEMGLDDIKRLGVARFLTDMQLITTVSVPQARLMSVWLEQIAGPLFMLIAFFLVTLIGFRISQRHVSQAREDYLQTEQALREQEGTLELLLSNLPGMIYRVRIPDYKVLFITDGCRKLLGYSAESYLSGQKTPFDDVYEEDQGILVKHIDSIKNPESTYEHIFRIHSPSGELKWVLDRGRAVQEGKKETYLEGILLDITEHMLSQQQVEYLATRDPLTELANRYLFNDELVNHIDKHGDQTTIALLFIDLDRFKTINDSLGHQVGDRLLKQVAERLQECVSSNCLLARLGGDEFMVMVRNPESYESVEALAHSINLVISKTYELDYYKLNTSCSIGISMYPQDSRESHLLLRNADTAMYNAKAKGGNRYQFYTDEMNQQANSRLTIETELRRAIKEDEFQLHYQPQVNLVTGELEGAEALVRWIHPTAGMVSPAEFIPVAEETGLIRDIGDWVLEKACSVFHDWNQQTGLNLSVAVNVSVRQLDDSFVLRVQEILNQAGMSAESLELEITESLLMDNVQENVRILENINRQGIRFAMDDFGTGYSSLSYLKQFPISKLKIDRSFVNDITEDPEDEAIIRAIIAMGQTLKLKVIAEGVENHQQLALLQNIGCNSYQGYFFSKPLPEDEFFEKYIKDNIGKISRLHN